MSKLIIGSILALLERIEDPKGTNPEPSEVFKIKDDLVEQNEGLSRRDLIMIAASCGWTFELIGGLSTPTTMSDAVYQLQQQAINLAAPLPKGQARWRKRHTIPSRVDYRMPVDWPIVVTGFPYMQGALLLDELNPTEPFPKPRSLFAPPGLNKELNPEDDPLVDIHRAVLGEDPNSKPFTNDELEARLNEELRWRGHRPMDILMIIGMG